MKNFLWSEHGQKTVSRES